MCCKRNEKVKTEENKVENSGSFTLGYIGNYLIREIFTCNHARHKQILSQCYSQFRAQTRIRQWLRRNQCCGFAQWWDDR